ncbi:MAG: glycoside hydrolase family 127 protein, partial [Limisphaerales bacterium]
VRFLPTIGGYLYAHDDKRILVNQYAASRAHMNVGSSEISLKQETKYPWDGAVKFTIEPQRKSKFTLALRIPNWCGNSSTNDLYQFEDKAQPITILVNGKSTKANIESGYATIDRKWKSGDVVQLNLPMPVRHVKAIDKVAADRGRVAIQRGPVVYCFEGDDNDDRARTLILSSNDSLTPEYRPSLLGGVTILRGRARAIPYFAWDNRDDGDMEVWLKSQPKN